MLWDTHMHTAFSTDSEASPESMIKASIELGLGGICITDHMDYDYPKEHPEDEPEFILDTPVYFPTIQKLGQQYKDKIKVLTGIELGLQPHLAAKHQKLISRYDFDFVIGSSHVITAKTLTTPAFLKEKPNSRLTRNILNLSWKILRYLIILMYMDISIMWYATVQTGTLNILIRNMPMSLMRF